MPLMLHNSNSDEGLLGSLLGNGAGTRIQKQQSHVVMKNKKRKPNAEFLKQSIQYNNCNNN